MQIPSYIQPFWKKFAATVDYNAATRFYEAFHFDDNQADADALAGLVLRGQKRATASLLWIYAAHDKPLPQVGDLSVVTNWQQEPLCVIETTQVAIVPYAEVSVDFAAAEGEGDGSLRHWRSVHWRFFARECQRLGREPGLYMPVVCERFRVIDSDIGRT